MTVKQSSEQSPTSSLMIAELTREIEKAGAHYWSIFPIENGDLQAVLVWTLRDHDRVIKVDMRLTKEIPIDLSTAVLHLQLSAKALAERLGFVIADNPRRRLRKDWSEYAPHTD